MVSSGWGRGAGSTWFRGTVSGWRDEKALQVTVVTLTHGADVLMPPHGPLKTGWDVLSVGWPGQRERAGRGHTRARSALHPPGLSTTPPGRRSSREDSEVICGSPLLPDLCLSPPGRRH